MEKRSCGTDECVTCTNRGKDEKTSRVHRGGQGFVGVKRACSLPNQEGKRNRFWKAKKTKQRSAIKGMKKLQKELQPG